MHSNNIDSLLYILYCQTLILHDAIPCDTTKLRILNILNGDRHVYIFRKRTFKQHWIDIWTLGNRLCILYHPTEIVHLDISCRCSAGSYLHCLVLLATSFLTQLRYLRSGSKHSSLHNEDQSIPAKTSNRSELKWMKICNIYSLNIYFAL